MGQIIVGIDGSDASNKALAWAINEAVLRHDVSVVAVHTYRPPEPPYANTYTDVSIPSGMAEEYKTQQRRMREAFAKAARQDAEKLIADAVDAIGAESGDVTLEHMPAIGDAARTLVDMSQDAILLVVGSRGRGGLKGRLLGSVSQKCLHHARCPVVVVR